MASGNNPKRLLNCAAFSERYTVTQKLVETTRENVEFKIELAVKKVAADLKIEARGKDVSPSKEDS